MLPSLMTSLVLYNNFNLSGFEEYCYCMVNFQRPKIIFAEDISIMYLTNLFTIIAFFTRMMNHFVVDKD